MRNTIEIDFLAGTTINNAASKLCATASQQQCVAVGDFNGKRLSATALSNPATLVKNYMAHCRVTSDRWRESPEGKACIAKQEEEYQKALNAAPKTFSIRTVLSCTTGRLLTKRSGANDNGIDDLYQLIDHALATSVSTLSLGVASRELSPFILELYPELKEAEEWLPVLDNFLQENPSNPDHAVSCWIEFVSLSGFNSEYSIPVFAGAKNA